MARSLGEIQQKLTWLEKMELANNVATRYSQGLKDALKWVLDVR